MKDFPTGDDATRECQHVHVSMLGKRSTGVVAGAGDDVEHAVGNASFAGHFREA
jgi:hypothetical protein